MVESRIFLAGNGYNVIVKMDGDCVLNRVFLTPRAAYAAMEAVLDAHRAYAIRRLAVVKPMSDEF